MRIAYLILAHNNPGHLKRMVKTLASPTSSFYVHIDKKSDIDKFSGLAGDDVKFCPERHDCVWGNISLVDATLELVQLALAENTPFDYLVLLSGACYPVQPVEYIHHFFEKNQGQEFIEAFPLPNYEYGKTLERLSRFWIKRGGRLDGMKWRLQKMLNRFLWARNYKKGLNGAVPIAGSQWWSLTHAAATHIVEFIASNPGFYRFCKNTDCPDEFVFQTILWNSEFRNKIRHSLTFTHWLPNKSGPEEIDFTYIPEIRKDVVLDSESNNCPNPKAEVLFARKFSDKSGPVLDVVDSINVGKRDIFRNLVENKITIN